MGLYGPVHSGIQILLCSKFEDSGYVDYVETELNTTGEPKFSVYNDQWKEITTGGDHVIFYIYIRTERIRIFANISLILNGFFVRQSADTSSFL